MPTLELETMRVELDGPLGRLRLNRPEALNAANWAWVRDLVTATDYLAQSAGTHVVIVSGEGRAFCSGLDTKELAQGNLAPEWFATWERGVVRLASLDAITIAAMHGYCLGGGLQVALACDLRIASNDAILSIPAVREGLVAALGPMRLATIIGASLAKQLGFFGHQFTAEEDVALRIIMREGKLLTRGKELSGDWAQFAVAGCAVYGPSRARVMRGELPWTNLDPLHRLSLNELLVEFKINDHFTEDEKDHLNHVWHRLQPWPDAIPGLTHLRKRFVLATLSNGNVALLVNMAKYSALPWDCILSAELVQAYKPDPRPYQMAVNLLGLRNHEVLMVAAHQEDLRAAQAQGMQAAFVPRPLKRGPHNVPDFTPDPAFEVVATDFMDLAQQLGP